MSSDFNPALTKEEVLLRPLYRYEGKIVLVQTETDLKNALEVISEQRFLGFDTETRPSFKKGKSYTPTLLQLATEEAVYLFRLQKISLDERLTELFSRADIVKAGVAVENDIRGLQSLYSFQAAGMVDLADLAAKNNIAQQSLRGLAACFLGVRISKTLRCSNWSQSELSPRQIVYAATDAWISLRVYLQARELGLA